MPDPITSDTLPASVDVPPAAGEEAGSEGVDSSVKDVLSRVLKKDFPSDEAALKAVKDTFSYVSDAATANKVVKDLMAKTGLDRAGVIKRMEEAAQAAAPAAAPAPSPAPAEGDRVKALERQVEDMSFYKANPDLESYKPFLDELRGTTGKPLTEIVSTEAFKTVLDRARAGDVAEKSRSVLKSSPRLGQATDKMTQAKEASKAGDHRTAGKSAVSAVLEAYELK